MTRLRTISVWLTAVLTVAAGFPQVVCACPGRPAKRGESSSAQTCACGGGCCSSAPSAKCCDGDRGPTKPAPTPGSGQTACKKTLIAQHAQISPAANSTGPNGDSSFSIAVSPSMCYLAPPGIVTATAWQLPPHAPPTDLLLLLQHLLI
jgi:hypothetical protein